MKYIKTKNLLFAIISCLSFFNLQSPQRSFTFSEYIPSQGFFANQISQLLQIYQQLLRSRLPQPQPGLTSILMSDEQALSRTIDPSEQLADRISLDFKNNLNLSERRKHILGIIDTFCHEKFISNSLPQQLNSVFLNHNTKPEISTFDCNLLLGSNLSIDEGLSLIENLFKNLEQKKGILIIKNFENLIKPTSICVDKTRKFATKLLGYTSNLNNNNLDNSTLVILLCDKLPKLFEFRPYSEQFNIIKY